jgi:hypothetical protein
MFWLSDTGTGNVIKEYNYTLSPFSYSLNRTINVPVTINKGMTHRFDTTTGKDFLIVNTGTTNQSIVELDITNTNASAIFKFNIIPNAIIDADMAYDSTNDRLTIAAYTGGVTTDGVILQYKYSNPTTPQILRGISVGDQANTKSFLRSTNGTMYSIASYSTANPFVYSWNNTSPYGATLLGTLSTNNIIFNGLSQPSNFFIGFT